MDDHVLAAPPSRTLSREWRQVESEFVAFLLLFGVEMRGVWNWKIVSKSELNGSYVEYTFK